MKSSFLELLHEKELLDKRLENLLYGSIEIRTRQEKKYIYLSYREQGIKYSKYAGLYSVELHNLINENNKIAKQYKKRLREINKDLTKFEYKPNHLGDDIKVNIDLAKRSLVDSIYKQARLEGVLKIGRAHV